MNISKYLKKPLVQRYFPLNVALIVGFVTVLIYLPTLNYEFVNWDDPQYIYNNKNIQSLDFSSLKWMFTDYYAANWHPLTWFSHAIDFTLWGKNPGGHHLSNILYHAINSVLVVILLFYLVSLRKSNQSLRNSHSTTVTLSGADYITISIAGFLFALHPLHVESVAWISERKDLLCAFFYISSLLLYINYTRLVPVKKKGLIYSCSLFCCIFALLSKPMAVTFPAVLVLLDFYPLNRFNRNNPLTLKGKILLEKTPFFLLSFGAIIITILAQKSWGAMSSLEARPLDVRFLVASKSICFYLLKILLPINLSPLYPYPNEISLLEIQTICSIVCILTMVCTFIFFWRKQKILLIIFTYYLITLLPVLGIVQVGGQVAADRYMYLPSIGIILLLTLGIACLIVKFWAREEKIKVNVTKPLIIILAIIFLSSNATLTLLQMTHWKDSISLWNRVISIYPNQSWVAYYNRASALQDSLDYQKAIEDFNKVIELNPFYPYGHYRRGQSHLGAEDYSKAISDFSRAIQLDNTKSNFYYYRGQAYRKLGEHNKALKDKTMAIRLRARKKR